MAVFELCFEKVLDLEGGYLLHEVPGDRGGMTFAGISRTAWPGWPGWHDIDAGRLGGDLSGRVQEFYKLHFWDRIQGDRIGFQGVAFVLYDFAVNAGTRAAVQTLQKIVNTSPDGVLGDKTFAALNGYVTDEGAEKMFMAEYSLARVYRYKDICMRDARRGSDKIRSNMKFLCGWINRVQKGVV